MPTGYTAYIENGKITNANDFLMLCARAFGACITMKEESFDTKIPEQFYPSTWYTEQLNEIKRELERYQSMTLDEAKEECERQYQDERTRRDNKIKEDKELLAKYNVILDGIKSWVPPTSEHQGLKDFAIEQIQKSLPEPGWSDIHIPLKKKNHIEWLAEQIENCQVNITNYEMRQQEENDRVASRNDWIRRLRESLT